MRRLFNVRKIAYLNHTMVKFPGSRKGGTYVLFLKTIDKYHENRERRARERAEWEAASRAQGRAEVIEQLREKGINVDDLLLSDEPDTESPETR